MDKQFIISVDKHIFKDGRTVCPVCGKSFYVSMRSGYVYKKNNKNGITRYACSNSCYNKLCEAIIHSVKTR